MESKKENGHQFPLKVNGEKKAENKTSSCLFLIAALRESFRRKSLKMLLLVPILILKLTPSSPGAPSPKFYPHHPPHI